MNKKILQEFKDYNKLMKSLGFGQKTLEEFCRIKTGKYKPKLRGVKQSKPYQRKSPIVQSGPSISYHATKLKENQYTGDKLIGIATMHKSNMVPVFSNQEAEDISKMRRS